MPWLEGRTRRKKYLVQFNGRNRLLRVLDNTEFEHHDTQGNQQHFHQGHMLSRELWAKAYEEGNWSVIQCLKIDRRLHLELAWKRQEEEEKRLRHDLESSSVSVVEVKSLAQHDVVIDHVGSSLVVVFFYSRSCGTCKDVLKTFEALSKEYQEQGASIVFTKHNVVDEFDGHTDMRQMYQVRAVPSFAFFAGGALVTRLSMRDSRGLRQKSIQIELQKDKKKLAETLRQLLFRIAPSAMR